MKKTGLILILLLFVFAQTALAHPPSKIDITYNPATKTVTAVIWHAVSNPKTHFIKKVDIGLNSQEIGTLEFKEQENSKEQTISYTLPSVRAGDKVSVEGYCNLSGNLTKDITIA